MGDSDWLARQFQESGTRLRAVAFRMLGSKAEADDAVQEAWLRLSRSNTGEVDNLGGWLTTVVARICLDKLRARKSRREEPMGPDVPEPASRERSSDPEAELTLADSVGSALLVVLETLGPAERVAFVLHDMFDLPFNEIAPIIGRSTEAARQLASRARRRVRGAAVPDGDVGRRRELVSAFLAASRDGDFDGLLAVLAPDAILRADEVAVRAAVANRGRGAPDISSEVRGASAVADAFKGRARAAMPAVINGDAGAVWAIRGRPRAAFVFTVEGDKISGIEIVMDPENLAELDIEIEGD